MTLRHLLVFTLLVFGLTGASYSAEKEETPEPVTTANPEIPVDELDLLLRPLTRTELEVETTGWLALLQEKIAEISEAEIGAKYKRTELQYADDLQGALDRIEKAKQAAAKAEAEAKAKAAAAAAAKAGAGELVVLETAELADGKSRALAAAVKGIAIRIASAR